MDIDNGVEKNIKLLAEAKNKKVSELRACVLKRPRHDEIVKELTKMNVKINYITDGDIAGVLSVIGKIQKMIFIIALEVVLKGFSLLLHFHVMVDKYRVD